MAKTLEAFRIEVDEHSVIEWKKKVPGLEVPEYGVLEYVIIRLVTNEYKKPHKIEIHKNHLRWHLYIDIYFDFASEQERFKFLLAGKGEELQKKLAQRIMNSELLRPIKVINYG